MARVGGRQGAFRVEGLREFQRELRNVDRTLGRDLRAALKRAAEIAAADARSRARSAGGVLGKAEVVASIKAQAEQRAAKISWGAAAAPMAAGAIMGAVQYAQFEPWVGAAWTPGVAGEGPRAINDAIASTRPRIEEAILDELDRLASRAFPD